MTSPDMHPVDEPDGEDNVQELDVEVDVDLDALDESLRREAIGQSTSVRIDGKVIHISHAGDWSSSAMQSASNGDWETWAHEVIDDPEELRSWEDADLRNYQMEAIFRECGRQSRMNMGKSQRRAGSRRNTRKR
jgi:hypothetical protein